MKTAIILFFTILASAIMPVQAVNKADRTAKHVRNLIKEGNEAYKNKDYTTAETCYASALQEDPNSEVAKFNYALVLLRKSGEKKQVADNAGNQVQADSLAMKYFNDLIGSGNKYISESSYYNLGNIAFYAGDYAKSIEMYKNVLRKDPGNMKARQNLRVAQMKMSKDGGGSNSQDDKKDSKDKNNQKDQKDNAKKEPPAGNEGQNDDKDGAPQKPEDQKNGENGDVNAVRRGMSDDNAKQILKAVRGREEKTLKRLENQKQHPEVPRIPVRPW